MSNENEEENDFSNNIIIIDHERCYVKYSQSYVFHNLDQCSSIKVLSDLDTGSWILWHYKQDGNERNAITIKLKEGYAHHYNFIFDVFNDNFQIFNILEDSSKIDQNVSKEYINENNKKTYVFEKYKTFYDFLLKLNQIYGLIIDKQVIYEND